MKKIKFMFLSFILALAGLAIALPMTFSSTFADEVALDVVEISDATSFREVLSNSSNYSKNIQLSQDISFPENFDLSSVWSVQTTTNFTGVFDGNGFALDNFTISSNSAYYGLFSHAVGVSEKAVIKNLKITGTTTFDIKNTTEPNLYLGILVGEGKNISIENCEIGIVYDGANENLPKIVGKGGGSLSLDQNFTYGNFAGTLTSGSNIQNCVAYTQGDFVSNLTDVSVVQIGGIVGVLDSSHVRFSASFSNFNLSASSSNVTFNYGGIAGEVKGSVPSIVNTISDINVSVKENANLNLGGVAGIITTPTVSGNGIDCSYWKSNEQIEFAYEKPSTYKLKAPEKVVGVSSVGLSFFTESKNWFNFGSGAWDFDKDWIYENARLHLQVFQTFKHYFAYELDNFSALDKEKSNFAGFDERAEGEIYVYKYNKPVSINIYLKNEYKGYYRLNSVMLGGKVINDSVQITPKKIVSQNLGDIEEGYEITFNATDKTDGEFYFNLEPISFTCEVSVAEGQKDMGGVRRAGSTTANPVELLSLGELTIISNENTNNPYYRQGVEGEGKGKYNFDHWELYYKNSDGSEVKCDEFDNSQYASLQQIYFYFGRTEFFNKSFRLEAHFSDSKAISVDFVYNTNVISEIRFYGQTFTQGEPIKVPPTARNVELVVVVKEGYEFDVNSFINFLTQKYGTTNTGSLSSHSPITQDGLTSFRVTGINIETIKNNMGERNDFTMEIRTNVKKTENTNNLTWLWVVLGIAGALGIAGGVVAFIVIRRRNVARRLGGGDGKNNSTKNKVKKTKAKEIDYKDYYN